MALLLSRPQRAEESGPSEATQARLATLIVRHVEPPQQVPARKVAPSSLAEAERPKAEGPGVSVGASEAKGSAGPRMSAGASPGVEPPLASGHARTRQRIVDEARATGVLRLLTSGSASGAGEQAGVLLGDDKVEADLGAVLGGVGGLKGTAQQPQQREVRGTRATEAGTIDTLVDELGAATSSAVVRGGSLVVGPVTPLTREGEVTTRAGRDPEQVSKIVNSHNDAIEYCYQKELKRNPTLRGRLVIRFTVNPQGKVTAATIVSSTLNSPELENCILRRVQRWDDFGVVDARLGDATFRQVYTFGF